MYYYIPLMVSLMCFFSGLTAAGSSTLSSSGTSPASRSTTRTSSSCPPRLNAVVIHSPKKTYTLISCAIATQTRYGLIFTCLFLYQPRIYIYGSYSCCLITKFTFLKLTVVYVTTPSPTSVSGAAVAHPGPPSQRQRVSYGDTTPPEVRPNGHVYQQ